MERRTVRRRSTVATAVATALGALALVAVLFAPIDRGRAPASPAPVGAGAVRAHPSEAAPDLGATTAPDAEGALRRHRQSGLPPHPVLLFALLGAAATVATAVAVRGRRVSSTSAPATGGYRVAVGRSPPLRCAT